MTSDHYFIANII